MSFSLATRTLSALALAALVPFVSVGSCTPSSSVDFDKCMTNSDCHAGFGLLSQCDVDTGLCEQLELHPRCATTAPFPPSLFTNVEEHSDSFVIASMFDQTPDVGDQLLVLAAELAVKEANEDQGDSDRGLAGRLFGIVHCRYDEAFKGDSLTEEEATREVAAWLGETLGVHAIVGPGTSSTATATFEELETFGTPIISPSATSESLTTIDGETKTDQSPGQFWRTVGSDFLTGAVMVNVLDGNGSKDVVVLHIDDDYGRGLANTLKDNFTGTAELRPYVNDSAITNAVIKLNGEEWDELVFIGASVTEVVRFITAAGKQVDGAPMDSPFLSRPILLSDTAANSSVLDQTADSPGVEALFTADSIRIVVPAADTESLPFEIFESNMDATYMVTPGAESYSAQTYDAAWLAIYGIAWAQLQDDGDLAPENIRRGLRKLSNKTDGREIDVDPLGWGALKQEFKSGNSVDILGASGELDFDPMTEETKSPLALKRIIEDANTDSGYTFETEKTVTP
jgi:branched-chain amino acid transport system substrate-binding protein